MKIPTNLFKFSFIALGWIVFILLCYVAFKDEKTNVLITMKDSLREAINIDYQERLNKILIHYRPLGRKVKGVQIEYYNPQIEMFAHFKTKSSFHKTKRII